MGCIFVQLLKQSQLVTLQLPAGCRVQRIIAGPDNRMWFTRAGTDEIGEIRADGKGCKFHSVRKSGEAPIGLHGLALAPDGSLWFTATAADRIGRRSPEGLVTSYDLPPGTRPLELTAQGDRMYFTLEGRSYLGSIHAMPPVQEPGAGETKAGLASREAEWSAVYRPKPTAAKKLTDSQRREAHQRREEQALRAPEARMAAEADEPESGEDEALRSEGKQVPQAEAAAAIGRILAPDGGFETPCTSADWVGWYQDRQSRPHRTRSFRVITEREYDEDGQEVHVVMTAYPIAEFW